MISRVFAFRELPKITRIHKTLVSDSVSKAKRLKLTHRIVHNHLLYRLLQTEHLVYFKKQSYVCLTKIERL